MKQEALQAVLLVKAIEDTDRNGALLSADQCERATRQALSVNGLPADGPPPDTPAATLASAIADRSHYLLDEFRVRHSALDDLRTLSGWQTWVALATLAAAFVTAWLASAIPKQINLLALPYVGVVTWNLAVYVWLLIGGLFTFGDGKPGIGGLLGVATRWVERRLIRHLSADNTEQKLLEIGRRYFEDWRSASAPVFAARVRAVLHLGAACMGLGLIAGLYFDLFHKHHEVVWESSLLDTHQVKWLVDHVLAGPASVAGIDLSPTFAELDAMHKEGTEIVGAPARPWMGALSVLLLMVVVLPRLVLAVIAGVRGGLLQRSAVVPDQVVDYARAVLGDQSARARVTVNVVPYLFEPKVGIEPRLQQHFRRKIGRGARCMLHANIERRDEHSIGELVRDAGTTAARWVILVSLRAKPDGDKHGILLIALRDAIGTLPGGLPIQLLIDEFVERKRVEPGWWHRWMLRRRRRQWRRFAGASRTEAEFLAMGPEPRQGKQGPAGP